MQRRLATGRRHNHRHIERRDGHDLDTARDTPIRQDNGIRPERFLDLV
jgi:hypothetical protein